MELIVRLVRSYECTLRNMFKWPPGAFQLRALEPSFAGFPPVTPLEGVEEEDKKSEGFLWGVPKRRRTVEKRWCRKIGASTWGLKLYAPKTNLIICDNCGHHHEAKHLCRNCYDKIQKETESIRQSVETQLGDRAEDRRIVVLYENEQAGEKAKNSILVELPKVRPSWFSRNLLEKSTTGADTKTTTVVTKTPNLS